MKLTLKAIASLLDDLEEGRRGGRTSVIAEGFDNAITGVSQIDTQQIAALSITFEVVDKSKAEIQASGVKVSVA